MLNSKKKIIFSISLLGLFILTLIGITYAYYSTNVTGNTEEKPSLSLKSGYLAIEYTDGTSSITGGSSGSTTEDLVYEKNFTITNTGVAEAFYGVWIKNYNATDASGNATTFTRPQDWTYTLKVGDITLSTGILPTSDSPLITAKELAVSSEENLVLTVTYNYSDTEDQSADMNKSLEFDVIVTQSLSVFENTSETSLLYALNRDNNITAPTTIPGQAPSAETEAVLAATEDDYGTSYYFRGNVTNNYVNFSGMCWRIVRVQGDGTIKLTLADRENPCNDGYDISDTDSAFITDLSQNFVYRYEWWTSTEGVSYANSDMKVVLEAWLNGGNYTYYDTTSSATTGTFTSKIDTENTNLVKAEWCDDTSITSHTYYDSNRAEITDASLAAYTDYNYGSFDRLNITTASPSLKCSTKGLNNSQSTKYTSKIGTLTADEFAFAGATEFSSGLAWDYYLMENSTANQYWIMTPFRFYSFAETVEFWIVANDPDTGSIYGTDSAILASLRPAIVLKSDVEVSTDSDTTTYGEPGTYTNPYVIS